MVVVKLIDSELRREEEKVCKHSLTNRENASPFMA